MIIGLSRLSVLATVQLDPNSTVLLLNYVITSWTHKKRKRQHGDKTTNGILPIINPDMAAPLYQYVGTNIISSVHGTRAYLWLHFVLEADMAHDWLKQSSYYLTVMVNPSLSLIRLSHIIIKMQERYHQRIKEVVVRGRSMGRWLYYR